MYDLPHYMVQKVGIIQEVLVHDVLTVSRAGRAARQLEYEISLDSEHLQ